MSGRSMGGKDHIIKQMILHTMEKCSVCGREFAEDDLRILGHQQDMWFLMVVCHNCRTQGILAVTVKEETVTQAPTDLKEEEIEAPVSTTPVTDHDVADMHRFLQEFDGNFASLFARE